MQYFLPDWILTVVAIFAVVVLYFGAMAMSLGVWYFEEENKRK